TRRRTSRECSRCHRRPCARICGAGCRRSRRSWLMSELTDRLERDLREIAAGAAPSPSAWDSIAARLGNDVESEVELFFPPVRARSKRIGWIMAAAAAIVVIIGLVAAFSTTASDGDVVPLKDPDGTTSPSIAPASTAALSELTTTFVSPPNGFYVTYH